MNISFLDLITEFDYKPKDIITIPWLTICFFPPFISSFEFSNLSLALFNCKDTSINTDEWFNIDLAILRVSGHQCKPGFVKMASWLIEQSYAVDLADSFRGFKASSCLYLKRSPKIGKLICGAPGKQLSGWFASIMTILYSIWSLVLVIELWN